MRLESYEASSESRPETDVLIIEDSGEGVKGNIWKVSVVYFQG